MITHKPNRNELPGVHQAILAAATAALAHNGRLFYSSGERAKWETRVQVFEKGIDLLFSNIDLKSQVMVLHYEGRHLPNAEYIEVQLCSKSNEDEIIGAFSARLTP